MDLKQIISNLVKKRLNENSNNITSFNTLTNKDLYNIAKWGLENDYSTSGCWDDSDTIEEAINCAIEDFELFLNKPYPIELGNFPNNPIIYRLIKLNNINELNKTNLGNSWFSNPKQTENPEFFEMLDYLKPSKNNQGTIYLLKGQTSQNNIDIPKTLWERSTQWWENEIVVIDDSKINLIKIEPFKY